MLSISQQGNVGDANYSAPMQMLKGDPLTCIFSHLNFIDRRILQKALHEDRDTFAKREVLFYNTRAPLFSKLLSQQNPHISKIKFYINLLGIHTHALQTLNLKGFYWILIDDIQEILAKCPNIKYLSCNNHRIIDLIKDNKTLENLECDFKIDPRNFPKNLIPKLTHSLDLRPEDDKELEEMFLILKDILPKITKLKITSLKLTGLPEGYTFPKLEYAEFSCSYLEKIGDMPVCQEIYLYDCYYLEEVGTMPMLQKWYFGLTHFPGGRIMHEPYDATYKSNNLNVHLKNIQPMLLELRDLQ
jgi:hypothetical protein